MEEETVIVAQQLESQKIDEHVRPGENDGDTKGSSIAAPEAEFAVKRVGGSGGKGSLTKIECGCPAGSSTGLVEMLPELSATWI